MEWDVVEVKAGHDWNMQVRFADGTQGGVKFEQSHLYGVFESLKDPTFFPGLSGLRRRNLSWQY